MRSYRALSIRRHNGSVVTAAPSFTTNLVRDNGAALTDDEIIQEALNILAARMTYGPALVNPQTTRDYLALRLSGLEYEVFGAVYLNQRHRVIHIEELFVGTIDGASVFPREVVKAALRHNAAAVLFFHNHPSSVSEPSQADELLTRRLKDALALVEIRVLDHIITGGDSTTSFAERGLL